MSEGGQSYGAGFGRDRCHRLTYSNPKVFRVAGIEILTTADPASLAAFDAVIDVRSPGEFALDHAPGAINLPVLTDAERAEVGTIYVQEDRFKARLVGAAYVAKNVAHHLQTALSTQS